VCVFKTREGTERECVIDEKGREREVECVCVCKTREGTERVCVIDERGRERELPPPSLVGHTYSLRALLRARRRAREKKQEK